MIRFLLGKHCILFVQASCAPLCWNGDGFHSRWPKAASLSCSGQPLSSSLSPNPESLSSELPKKRRAASQRPALKKAANDTIYIYD